MSNNCLSNIAPLENVHTGVSTGLRALNIIIALLNMVGNGALIYALKKTGQTKSISIKFIMFMSISDFTNGVIGISLLNLILWGKLDHCILKAITQMSTNVSSVFSILMVCVIALDRYFHMRYLERYPSVMNNKRGYCMAIACLFSTTPLVAMEVLILRFARDGILIVQFALLVVWLPLFGGVIALYYKAYRSLRLRASSQMNQFVKNALCESRKFAKIAKLIIISLGILVTPMLICLSLQFVNHLHRVVDERILHTVFWFSLLLHLANGFTSSLIFMLYNTSVKELLRHLMTGKGSHVNVVSSLQ